MDRHILLCYPHVLYFQGLFALSNDDDAEVRKNVCRAIVMLVEVRVEQLIPNMNNLVEVIIS